MQYLNYTNYAVSIARRLIRYRRSSMIDESDLINSSLSKLWEHETKGNSMDVQIARRTIRFAMLEVLRSSSMLKMSKTTSMNQAIQAYTNILNEQNEPSYNPIEEWIEEDSVRQVWLIVEGFSYDDRLLLSLIWEQGCSMQVAADVLDVSKSLIFKRYHTLLDRIKNQVSSKKVTI
ncbi:sigma-70 family RNA polymerase sigma factor [Alicyclobacillus fodiniaquatilis]|uniref:Sigma-70 family RNA polymerase sigma factor n=1 Tax=Alicyclobacillus fodiniaquatilis TaxID=1661150 RepID=A0ABW4JRX3_9BACL